MPKGTVTNPEQPPTGYYFGYLISVVEQRKKSNAGNPYTAWLWKFELVAKRRKDSATGEYVWDSCDFPYFVYATTGTQYGDSERDLTKIVDMMLTPPIGKFWGKELTDTDYLCGWYGVMHVVEQEKNTNYREIRSYEIDDRYMDAIKSRGFHVNSEYVTVPLDPANRPKPVKIPPELFPKLDAPEQMTLTEEPPTEDATTDEQTHEEATPTTRNRQRGVHRRTSTEPGEVPQDKTNDDDDMGDPFAE